MAQQEHFIRRETFQDSREEEDEDEADPPDEATDLEQQLTSFRQQWQAELQAVGAAANTGQPRGSPHPSSVTPASCPPAVDEKNAWLDRSSRSTNAPYVPSFVIVDPTPAVNDGRIIKQDQPTAAAIPGGTKKQQQQQQQLPPTDAAEGKVPKRDEDDNANTTSKKEDTIETKAKELFIQGVNAERNGNLSEAICKYRHAIQLVPDVESKITDYTVNQPKNEDDADNDIQEGYEDVEDDNNPEDDSMEELASELQALTTNDIKSHCDPEFQQTSTHISALPIELLLYIFRWVVSSDLDLRSLELLSLVCRGFYVCTRDPALWHRACLSIFGPSCCKTKEYGTWRQMYLERPHPNFNGVYISRNTYFRKGEPDMDGLYRPWHMVEYYRYVRLFPDGTMLMYSAPDEPKVVVSKLRSQTTSLQSVVVGHYRLVGDMITGVLRRENNKVYDNHLHRYIRYKRHMNITLDTEYIFHVEFAIRSSSHRPNYKLEWHSYSCHTHHRPTGCTSITDFDVDKKFKPLIFSRVKSYTQLSEKPL